MKLTFEGTEDSMGNYLPGWRCVATSDDGRFFGYGKTDAEATAALLASIEEHLVPDEPLTKGQRVPVWSGNLSLGWGHVSRTGIDLDNRELKLADPQS